MGCGDEVMRWWGVIAWSMDGRGGRGVVSGQREFELEQWYLSD